MNQKLNLITITFEIFTAIGTATFVLSIGVIVIDITAALLEVL